MSLVELVASWSKDRKTKCGAVIVDDRNVVVSLGWNGFPRGIDDDVDERHERPEKYLWTSHCEDNAICNAAAKGVSTLGATIYINWYPCARCANNLMQAGIKKLVCPEPEWEREEPGRHDWPKEFRHVRDKLKERGIEVIFFE